MTAFKFGEHKGVSEEEKKKIIEELTRMAHDFYTKFGPEGTMDFIPILQKIMDDDMAAAFDEGVPTHLGKIDVNRANFYEHNHPEWAQRTHKRLVQIATLGAEEIEPYHFGMKGVWSGLYLEMIWNDPDRVFEDYITWVKQLIKKSKQK